jgi:hypothetical protein
MGKYVCELCEKYPCACRLVVPPGHPWADFLNARARAIDWLYYREGPCMHDDAAIAKTLSMDPMQVMLIRRRDEKPGDNQGQVTSLRRGEGL